MDVESDPEDQQMVWSGAGELWRLQCRVGNGGNGGCDPGRDVDRGNR